MHIKPKVRDAPDEIDADTKVEDEDKITHHNAAKEELNNSAYNHFYFKTGRSQPASVRA